MAYVIRRRQARHDGTRYFNDKGSAVSHADRGAVFDLATQAEAARAKLREPHLWTVMLLRDAERADAVEHYERKIAEHARPFNPLSAALSAALVARPIDAVRTIT